MEASTVRDVIRILGGLKVVAARAHRKYNAVSHWQCTNRVPAEHWLWMRRALADLGYSAPDELWGMHHATPTIQPHTVPCVEHTQ